MDLLFLSDVLEKDDIITVLQFDNKKNTINLK